jgi:alkaline phosphatase D
MIKRLAMLIALLLCSALPFAAGAETVRFASFNAAMGLQEEGELARRLESGEDENLKKLAEILQRMRPDVILLNEFDFQEDIPAARLFNENYLAKSQRGQEPISYPYSFVAPVNTGIDSGADLNQNGVKGDPADAYGFGHFPGQFGMLLLSRFPINHEAARTFQNFAWDDMPNAARPLVEDGNFFYLEENWLTMRLSSKSHWDVPIIIDENQSISVFASHPTPPVFDGPEDRNGARNKDEIRFWMDYLSPGKGDYIYDDKGKHGGMEPGGQWIIAGDLNADARDGASRAGSIDLFSEGPHVNWTCVPASAGAAEAAEQQGGVNAGHQGDPKYDTADFNDEYVGNLRADYLITSLRSKVTDCGVYWPAAGEDGRDLIDLSDHRMVWMDLEF